MSILKESLLSVYQKVADTATRTDASDALKQVRAIQAERDDIVATHSSAIEAAFRGKLIELIATLDIQKDDFSPIWSLLDAVNLLCDNELCDFTLGFWLVEDLLDSQTIRGSLEVVQYLESRRERMTKVNFEQKKLSILRCCNELLRRLSRAEDTVFCGRVFIYLFQSFPLGDKSSVNLRGEFHVENVTAYDQDSPADDVDDRMQVDAKPSSDPRETGSDTNTSLSHLYPVFWSLQALFSTPTKLFDNQSMQSFKDGIKQTLSCFAQVADNATVPTNNPQDSEQRGQKRKREETDGNSQSPEFHASTFNPKYLTNRDLFALEVHDIEFRRHVLVQALILLDFLLSLSPSNKAKLSTINPSKSIMLALYDKYTLSEENRLWAIETRRQIEKYLEEANGTEGRYYLRMVNMVLSRDRNWALWKAEGCPSISKPSVLPAVETESQTALGKITSAANASLTKPKGSDQLAFLSSTEPVEELRKRRTRIPTLEEYHKAIQTEDLDLDFATDEQEKKEIEERKAGKLWRALRSAQGKRFRLCEEIKNGDDLDALIGKVKVPPESGSHEQPTGQGQNHDQTQDEHPAKTEDPMEVSLDTELVKVDT